MFLPFLYQSFSFSLLMCFHNNKEKNFQKKVLGLIHKNPNNLSEYFVTKLKKSSSVVSFLHSIFVKIVKRLQILVLHCLSILHNISRLL